MASVYLAVPVHPEMGVRGCALRSIVAATGPAGHRAHLDCYEASLLVAGFNQLWANALNARRRLGLTHFAMHHADLGTLVAGWLDIGLAEMDRTGADLLSVVIPTKHLERGITSTGLYDPETRRVRVLTLREVQALPPTFSAADTDSPGRLLVVNSGLWVCRFTEPWVEDGICFATRDAVVRGPNGEFGILNEPEDWHFSLECHRRGLRVLATRAIPVVHRGVHDFRSDQAWGTWDRQRDAGRLEQQLPP